MVYFQEVGPAEAEFEADPRHFVRSMLCSASGEGMANPDPALLDAPREGTGVPRHPHPAARDAPGLDHRGGRRRLRRRTHAGRLVRARELLPQHGRQLGAVQGHCAIGLHDADRFHHRIARPGQPDDAGGGRGHGGGPARLPRQTSSRGRATGCSRRGRPRRTPRCWPSSRRCERTRRAAGPTARRALAHRGLARGHGAVGRGAGTAARPGLRPRRPTGRDLRRGRGPGRHGDGGALRGRARALRPAADPGHGGHAAAQLVDGQVGVARRGGRAGRGAQARPQCAGRRTGMVGRRRSPPRHHPAPAPDHPRRAGLGRGLRRRSGVRRHRDALRRRPAGHGPLRGRPAAGRRTGDALQLFVGHLEHRLGHRGPPGRPRRGLPRFLPRGCSPRSA